MPLALGPRFYESPLWRFVVTKRDHTTLTFLSALASNRAVVKTLNGPMEARMRVPADSPEVNILHTDGDPFVDEGDRFLLGFRREELFNEGNPPWIIRFAGVIQQIADNGDADRGTTDLVAYDPWRYLYTLPIRNNDGDLPPPDGLRFIDEPANEIILGLLQNAIDAGDFTDNLIDAGVAWGGTAEWAGTLETCEEIPELVLQRGTTLGEAWAQVTETGHADIVLDPIYDPILRPGYLCDLSIYELAGDRKEEAIFAWDLPSRSVTGIGRTRDGTQRANRIDFYAGQGGVQVGLREDAASIAKYGPYWKQEMLADQPSKRAANLKAGQILKDQLDGLYTYQADAAPERCPIPFNEFTTGDRVQLAASSNLREGFYEFLRVLEFTLEISDDALEHIEGMTLALTGWTEDE